MEVYVGSMGQRSKDVAMKDATSERRKEESASGTEGHQKSATKKGAPTMPRKEVYVGGMGQSIH